MSTAPAARADAWAVLVVTSALLLHDHLARSVIGPVLPVLKSAWALSDSRLGALLGVAALMVAALVWPLSLAARRWGRVKVITAAVVMWSAATVACGLAASYGQLLLARALVGVAEAAYGATTLTLLASAFPQRRRAAACGALQSAAAFGAAIGIAIGGTIAAAYGWRAAFVFVGAPGLLLAVAYPLLVREGAAAEHPGSVGHEGSAAAGEGAAPQAAAQRRRTLTRQNAGPVLAAFVGALPTLARALIRPRTSRALREKVVLAVTAINDCRLCAWGHGHWARAVGVPLDEINQILRQQHARLAATNSAEAAALLIASQYAEQDGRVDDRMLQALRAYFDDGQRQELLAYVRAISLGNLLGNTLAGLVECRRRTAPIGGEPSGDRAGRSAVVAYGLLLGSVGCLAAWMPTYLYRDFALPLQNAALLAAVAVLAMGVGMIAGGAAIDRYCASTSRNRIPVIAALAAFGGVALIGAFTLPPGPPALALMLAGALSAAAPSGPAAAMALASTPRDSRTANRAVPLLVSTGLGAATIPFLVGLGSDVVGLKLALACASAVPIGGAICFLLAARREPMDMARGTGAA
jgi:AhpD family alkylhydroperoxidase